MTLLSDAIADARFAPSQSSGYCQAPQHIHLVMTGWMCCGAWQYPELWDGAKRASAMASDSSVMLWLRDKPSVMVWLNGSDMPPRDTSVERGYLNIEAAL